MNRRPPTFVGTAMIPPKDIARLWLQLAHLGGREEAAEGADALMWHVGTWECLRRADVALGRPHTGADWRDAIEALGAAPAWWTP